MADRLLFLGTGAADWKMEHKETYPDFRRYSAALVNDDLLIDCGPHIFDFAESIGRPDLYDGVTASRWRTSTSRLSRYARVITSEDVALRFASIKKSSLHQDRGGGSLRPCLTGLYYLASAFFAARRARMRSISL